MMEAARGAGQAGEIVIPGRRTGSEEAIQFWGMSIQEEKEMILIITEQENKLESGPAGHQCKMRTAQRGGRAGGASSAH